MCQIIELQKYRYRKLEHEYLEFYTYMEQFFGEKVSEKDVVRRIHCYSRALTDLSLILNKYLKTPEASEGIRKISKAYAKVLRKTVEILEE